jgi:hypothetical protein
MERTLGVAARGNVCGVHEPLPGAGCVDPAMFGVSETVDCDGALLDGGDVDAGTDG